MRISTKGIYALEIVVDLAMHCGGGQLEKLKNIADRRTLSAKYLERIVKGLKDAGVISSVRGAYGGYCLAKKAADTNVREVLAAVEGELVPVACLTKETDCGIDCDACLTRGVWRRIWEAILETAEQVTVQDIIDEIGKNNAGY